MQEVIGHKTWFKKKDWKNLTWMGGKKRGRNEDAVTSLRYVNILAKVKGIICYDILRVSSYSSNSQYPPTTSVLLL